MAPEQAVEAALGRLRGAFALAILFEGEDDLMIGARRGSPLAIGHGDGEMFFGSDAIALSTLTDRITYLEDGDWAVLTRSGLSIRDASGAPVTRPMVRTLATSMLIDKGNHRHFMAKEIYEQPEVVGHTLAHYIDFAGRAFGDAGGFRHRLRGARPHLDHRLRHRLFMPGWSPNTGSSASPGCRSTSISPPSSATASSR